MSNYEFQKIEEKWQKAWEKNKSFEAKERDSRPKYYCLVMFPYPSGKLHMGHVRNYSIGDVFARFYAMNGHQVLHPIGWDAFGLPAENAAIEHKIHPEKWTRENIHHMDMQLKKLGISYDWSREFATCDTEYYKWNQWFFIKMFEKGLAYRKKARVNWCPKCQTVLANEQVHPVRVREKKTAIHNDFSNPDGNPKDIAESNNFSNGVNQGICWRCDAKVQDRDLEQWFLKITDYADELLSGHEKIKDGWPQEVLLMQNNWIGKSIGAEVDFEIDSEGSKFKTKIRVFTTRPDTLFGATFMVLAPEHSIVNELKTKIKNWKEVEKYIAEARKKSNIDRTTEKEKTGIKLEGLHAINPVNNTKIPIFIADYVLTGYGTGAIMAVPAHDSRDWAFAKKYNIPIVEVISDPNTDLDKAAYEGEGVMINSGEFNGIPSKDAVEKVTEWVDKKGLGNKSVNFRLKDWLVSRQRYWGTPIPMIHCESCGTVPIPEKDLPVILPSDVKLTGKGTSPLAESEKFVNVKCPKCGEKAKRETDTMDTFVDSSWYFARYCDPENKKLPFDKKKIDSWMPVDQYIGGIEHACMHLIYARFWHKIMRDLGLLSCDEPFEKLLTQGMVTLGGSAMSKSRGNVIAPDEIIEKYGADTARLFILFASPPEKQLDWSDAGVEGAWRFINRVWRLLERVFDAKESKKNDKEKDDNKEKLTRKMHLTTKKVTNDIKVEKQLNTAIAAVMELVNEIYLYPFAGDEISKKAVETVILLLSPYVPHVCEEMWKRIGNKESLLKQKWPAHDEKYIIQDTIDLPVQINGKLRGTLQVPTSIGEQELMDAIKAMPKFSQFLENKSIKKFIYVQKKIVNIVVN
ncbi:leucine--tRNA ligase [Elusimicrobiota bacterium]